MTVPRASPWAFLNRGFRLREINQQKFGYGSRLRRTGRRSQSSLRYRSFRIVIRRPLTNHPLRLRRYWHYRRSRRYHKATSPVAARENPTISTQLSGQTFAVVHWRSLLFDDVRCQNPTRHSSSSSEGTSLRKRDGRWICCSSDPVGQQQG
jgi:hypothetical protein